MEMKKINQYILLLFVVLLTSCYNEFSFNVEPADDKIVINGLINNLDTLAVTVTKSFSPGGDVVIDELENAQVSIFENDNYLGQMHYRKSESDVVGKFVADFIPIPGNSYRINVTDFLGESQALTSTPVANGVSNFSATLTNWGSDGWNKPRRYRFSVTLNDSEDVNYYFLRVYMKIYHKDTGIDEINDIALMNGEVLSSSIPEQTKYVYGGILFTDEGFNGQQHVIDGTATLQDTSLVVNSLTGVEVDPEDVIVDTGKLYLQLESLSRETYLFYKTHAKVVRIAKYSTNYNYQALTPVYSNVENGYGIFGGLYKNILVYSLDN